MPEKGKLPKHKPGCQCKFCRDYATYQREAAARGDKPDFTQHAADDLAKRFAELRELCDKAMGKGFFETLQKGTAFTPPATRAKADIMDVLHCMAMTIKTAMPEGSEDIHLNIGEDEAVIVIKRFKPRPVAQGFVVEFQTVNPFDVPKKG